MRERAATDGREVAVLTHVVGTERDPQSLIRQQAILRDAGAHVLGSNERAAVGARLLVEAAAV
jgi:hypothetical protein